MSKLIILIDSLEANLPFIRWEIKFLSENFSDIFLLPINHTNKDNAKINGITPILKLSEYLSKNKRKFLNHSNFENIHLLLKEIKEISINKFFFYNLFHTFYTFHLSILIKDWLLCFINTERINTDN